MPTVMVPGQEAVGPQFTVVQHQPSKRRVLSIDKLWVCPECGSFAVPDQKSVQHRCPAHPDTPAQHRHITVPDPYMRVGLNGSTVRPVVDPRKPVWIRNYKANMPRIGGESVYDLPQSDVVYLVGCGPSLETHGHYLRHAKDGIIITLNAAVIYVLNADYFLCMDHAFNRTHGNKDATAILSATVSPDLLNKPWKDVRWMRSSAQGEPFSAVHKNHPNLRMYDEGLNCSFTAFQLIAQIFNPKVLVLLGLDCGFTQDRERVGKALEWNPNEAYHVIPGVNGRPALSNGLYARIVVFSSAALAWFPKHGCQVINACEGGALARHVTVHSVEEVYEAESLATVIKAVNSRNQKK